MLYNNCVCVCRNVNISKNLNYVLKICITLFLIQVLHCLNDAQARLKIPNTFII